MSNIAKNEYFLTRVRGAPLALCSSPVAVEKRMVNQKSNYKNGDIVLQELRSGYEIFDAKMPFSSYFSPGDLIKNRQLFLILPSDNLTLVEILEFYSL